MFATKALRHEKIEMLKDTLFIYPIHAHSPEVYKEKEDKDLQKKKKELEAEIHIPFDELSPEQQANWNNLWAKGPWIVDDIIGFLNIGFGVGSYITANIYLKCKFLPRGHWRKRFSASPLGNQRFFYWISLGKYNIDKQDNDTFVDAIKKIFQEAKLEIKKHNNNFYVWTPPFDLDYINYVKVYQQIREST